MNYYRRNLPHYQPPGAEYFVTFRLADSLPKSLLDQFEEQNPYPTQRTKGARTSELKEYEKARQRYIHRILDRADSGPKWLIIPRVASVVQEALHFRDTKKYDLYAYSIMANHVHVVCRHIPDIHPGILPENYYPITEIFGALKNYTATKANEILNRVGEQFWQHESYDHVIRNSDELTNTIGYTLYNPVDANIVKEWREWPYNYCKPGWADEF